MAPTDVDAATELILGNDWGVRREWLEFATTQAACIPMVAEADGEIVGTGVGTVNGPAGWIGTIFIAPDRRGHGLGRAITQATSSVSPARSGRSAPWRRDDHGWPGASAGSPPFPRPSSPSE